MGVRQSIAHALQILSEKGDSSLHSKVKRWRTDIMAAAVVLIRLVGFAIGLQNSRQIARVANIHRIIIDGMMQLHWTLQILDVFGQRYRLPEWFGGVGLPIGLKDFPATP